jgi:hypothetical protein
MGRSLGERRVGWATLGREWYRDRLNIDEDETQTGTIYEHDTCRPIFSALQIGYVLYTHLLTSSHHYES